MARLVEAILGEVADARDHLDGERGLAVAAVGEEDNRAHAAAAGADLGDGGRVAGLEVRVGADDDGGVLDLRAVRAGGEDDRDLGGRQAGGAHQRQAGEGSPRASRHHTPIGAGIRRAVESGGFVTMGATLQPPAQLCHDGGSAPNRRRSEGSASRRRGSREVGGLRCRPAASAG